MTKLVFWVVAISMLFFFSACSSVDGDAKKAAELNRKSLEYIKDNDLEKAAKLYQEMREIVANYDGTEDYEAFHAAYNQYMIPQTNN